MAASTHRSVIIAFITLITQPERTSHVVEASRVAMLLLLTPEYRFMSHIPTFDPLR